MVPGIKLEDLKLSKENFFQETKKLKDMQEILSTTENIWISDSAYLISKTKSDTVDVSTYNSQIATYSPFEFRVIFTEKDGYDYLRALTFGLFFNIFAFQ